MSYRSSTRRSKRRRPERRPAQGTDRCAGRSRRRPPRSALDVRDELRVRHRRWSSGVPRGRRGLGGVGRRLRSRFDRRRRRTRGSHRERPAASRPRSREPTVRRGDRRHRRRRRHRGGDRLTPEPPGRDGHDEAAIGIAMSVRSTRSRHPGSVASSQSRWTGRCGAVTTVRSPRNDHDGAGAAQYSERSPVTPSITRSAPGPIASAVTVPGSNWV